MPGTCRRGAGSSRRSTAAAVAAAATAAEAARATGVRTPFLAHDLAAAWRRVTTVAANKDLLSTAGPGGLGRLSTLGQQGYIGGLQHKLTQAKLQRAFDDVLAAATGNLNSPNDRARLLGVSAKGASAYLQALPNKEDLVHEDDIARIVLSIRLGLDVVNTVTVPVTGSIVTAAVPTCAVPPISVQHPQTGRRRYVTQEERESLPPCGGTVEPKGYHHLGQCKTGTHNPINRHNAILRSS